MTRISWCSILSQKIWINSFIRQLW